MIPQFPFQFLHAAFARAKSGSRGTMDYDARVDDWRAWMIDEKLMWIERNSIYSCVCSHWYRCPTHHRIAFYSGSCFIQSSIKFSKPPLPSLIHWTAAKLLALHGRIDFDFRNEQIGGSIYDFIQMFCGSEENVVLLLENCLPLCRVGHKRLRFTNSWTLDKTTQSTHSLSLAITVNQTVRYRCLVYL